MAELTPYGYLVPAARAAEILAAAGIDKYTPIDPYNGENFTYQGTVYWILQRDIDFGPGQYSPDGVHLVYSPSPEEVDLGNVPSPFDFLKKLFSDLAAALGSTVTMIILLAAILALVWILVNKKS